MPSAATILPILTSSPALWRYVMPIPCCFSTPMLILSNIYLRHAVISAYGNLRGSGGCFLSRTPPDDNGERPLISIGRIAVKPLLKRCYHKNTFYVFFGLVWLALCFYTLWRDDERERNTVFSALIPTRQIFSSLGIFFLTIIGPLD